MIYNVRFRLIFITALHYGAIVENNHLINPIYEINSANVLEFLGWVTLADTYINDTHVCAKQVHNKRKDILYGF